VPSGRRGRRKRIPRTGERNWDNRTIAEGRRTHRGLVRGRALRKAQFDDLTFRNRIVSASYRPSVCESPATLRATVQLHAAIFPRNGASPTIIAPMVISGRPEFRPRGVVRRHRCYNLPNSPNDDVAKFTRANLQIRPLHYEAVVLPRKAGGTRTQSGARVSLYNYSHVYGRRVSYFGQLEQLARSGPRLWR